MKFRVIKVYIKTPYGRGLIYPGSKNARALLASISKNKTFTLKNVADLKKLGYRFDVSVSSKQRSDTALACHDGIFYNDDGSIEEYGS